MKYLVTVRGTKITEEIYSVEAATENEAAKSAYKLAEGPLSQLNKNTIVVTSIVEDIEIAHGPTGVGYVARII